MTRTEGREHWRQHVARGRVRASDAERPALDRLQGRDTRTREVERRERGVDVLEQDLSRLGQPDFRKVNSALNFCSRTCSWIC